MGARALAKNPLVWVGAGAVILLLSRRSSSGPTLAPNPGGGSPKACGYQPGMVNLEDTRDGQVKKVLYRMLKYNPRVNDSCATCNNRAVGLYIAQSLVDAARSVKLPLDLLTALAQRESSFNPEVSDIKGRLEQDRAIGPLQVRKIAFLDVGLNPYAMIGAPDPNNINYSILAGAWYLAKLRDRYLPGASWCDLLHAYNVGPNAFKAGKRNWPYVNKIIGWANEYTELK
jgi:hypothetical protein